MKMPVFTVRENREGYVNSFLLKWPGTQRTYRDIRKITLWEKRLGRSPEISNLLEESSYHMSGTAFNAMCKLEDKLMYLDTHIHIHFYLHISLSRERQFNNIIQNIKPPLRRVMYPYPTHQNTRRRSNILLCLCDVI